LADLETYIPVADMVAAEVLSARTMTVAVYAYSAAESRHCAIWTRRLSAHARPQHVIYPKKL